MSQRRRYHSGEICPESGLYRLISHKGVSDKQAEIPLTKGERFPPCRNCTEPVEWELVCEAKLEND